MAKNQTPPITPSSRSITPPCPGISRLASFTPKRRFTADFEQVAALGEDRDPEAQQPDAERMPADHEPGEEHAHEARGREPAERPGPGLAGADRRPELGAPDPPADEVGADVGRHHHHHQPEDEQTPSGSRLRKTSNAPIAAVM